MTDRTKSKSETVRQLDEMGNQQASRPEPPEWEQTETPYFKSGDVVQLRKDWSLNVPQYYVIDGYQRPQDGVDNSGTYFLRPVYTELGLVEQMGGIHTAPSTLVPHTVAELPPLPELTQVDCEEMEGDAVCSTDSNVLGDKWCEIPSWAYYKSGQDCYDVRDLLRHFDYQVTRDARHVPAPLSLPNNRQAIGAGQLEYIMTRARLGGFAVPINVQRAFLALHDAALWPQFPMFQIADNDPVWVYLASPSRQIHDANVERLREEETDLLDAEEEDSELLDHVYREAFALRPAP